MERVIWQELWPLVENSVEKKLGKSTPQSHFSPICPPVPCLHLMSAKPNCQPQSRAPIGAVQAGQFTRSQSRAEEGGGRGWGHTEAISSPWPRVQTNRRKGKISQAKHLMVSLVNSHNAQPCQNLMLLKILHTEPQFLPPETGDNTRQLCDESYGGKAKYLMHAKSLQSCPTLGDPMDCSPPGSSVHGILQARVLEWVACALLPTQGSNPRLSTSTCIGRRVLYH